MRLYLYYTKTTLLVVGRGGVHAADGQRQYSLLRINRADTPSVQAVVDPVQYLLPQLNSVLNALHAANLPFGGLQFVTKAYGVIGAISFTASPLLLIITTRLFVGSICGHKVYRVGGVALLPLGASLSQHKDSPTERRYRKLFMSVDLSHNFFFSLTYPLAHTLQHNWEAGLLRAEESDNGQQQWDSMFCWNAHLTKELRGTLGGGAWVVALVHGSWDQRRLSVLGRPTVLTLLARRSRYFAGTRFKKRGLSEQGKVANEVETEQILDAGTDVRTGLPLVSSSVQVRGSVPLFWSQQPTTLSPKPDVLLQTFDPLYQATQRHFDDLRSRYGSPIVCLNLLRSHEKRHARETLLRDEMGAAISFLNAQGAKEDRVVHVPWDLAKHAKVAGAGLLPELSAIMHIALEATGMFVHNPLSSRQSQKQTAVQPAAWCLRQWGILRTNCIDCLDRTNVAQFAHGLSALGLQLFLLGLADCPEIDSDSSMALNLMAMYEKSGNTLALQYGGSEAHSQLFQRWKGEWEASTRSKDLFTSITRFYNNTYTDAEKQDAINLFLGNFVVRGEHAHLGTQLWELEHDVYLHTRCADAEPDVAFNLKHPPSQGTLRDACFTLGLPCERSVISISSDEGEDPASLSDFASLLGDPMGNTYSLLTGAAALAAASTTNLPSLHHLDGSLGSGAMPAGGQAGNTGKPGSSTGNWSFTGFLASLFGPSTPLAPPLVPSPASSSITFFDALLASPCRQARGVRLYTARRGASSGQQTIMWQQAQKAFTYFWADAAMQLPMTAGAGVPIPILPTADLWSSTSMQASLPTCNSASSNGAQDVSNRSQSRREGHLERNVLPLQLCSLLLGYNPVQLALAAGYGYPVPGASERQTMSGSAHTLRATHGSSAAQHFCSSSRAAAVRVLMRWGRALGHAADTTAVNALRHPPPLSPVRPQGLRRRTSRTFSPQAQHINHTGKSPHPSVAKQAREGEHPARGTCAGPALAARHVMLLRLVQPEKAFASLMHPAQFSASLSRSERQAAKLSGLGIGGPVCGWTWQLQPAWPQTLTPLQRAHLRAQRTTQWASRQVLSTAHPQPGITTADATVTDGGGAAASGRGGTPVVDMPAGPRWRREPTELEPVEWPHSPTHAVFPRASRSGGGATTPFSPFLNHTHSGAKEQAVPYLTPLLPVRARPGPAGLDTNLALTGTSTPKPGSMNATTRAMVGIGPTSASSSKHSPGKSAFQATRKSVDMRQVTAPLIQRANSRGGSSDGKWGWAQAVLDLPNSALTNLGLGPADRHKPPIPVLNDFIEIGPGAAKTLVARARAAGGEIPAWEWQNPSPASEEPDCTTPSALLPNEGLDLRDDIAYSVELSSWLCGWLPCGADFCRLREATEGRQVIYNGFHHPALAQKHAALARCGLLEDVAAWYCVAQQVQGHHSCPAAVAAVHQSHEAGVAHWLAAEGEKRRRLKFQCGHDGSGPVGLQWWQSPDCTVLVA